MPVVAAAAALLDRAVALTLDPAQRADRALAAADAKYQAGAFDAALGLLAGLAAGFGYAPREAVQGNVQRIMYLHVPSVWVAYLAFGVVLVASIAYLVRRAESADRLAHASAEVGVLFTGLTIALTASGPSRRCRMILRICQGSPMSPVSSSTALASSTSRWQKPMTPRIA